MIESHHGNSVRSQVVGAAAKVVAKPVLRWTPVNGPVAPVRHGLDLGARLTPRNRRTRVEKVTGNGWHGELVSSKDARPGTGAIVYFHGGAFVFCGLATHRRIVEHLALRTGLPVLNVAYRQHGRAKLEQSIVDCVDATNWMIDRGFDPERLVVAGDSAGGHLAFAVALEATGQHIPLAGVVGLSPWLEFDNTERRNHVNPRRDHYIPMARLETVARTVTGKPILEPTLSPVNRELAGLPPTLLICAADEILRYDTEIMNERLERAGVPVTTHVWEGQVHAFPVLGDLTPESSHAVDLISAFVRERVGVRTTLRSVPDLAV